MEEGLVIHSDGGSRGNPGPGACAFTVEENGKVIAKESKYLGKVTNNFAEYQGVLLGLDWLLKNMPAISRSTLITFYLDSELVVKQLNGLYKIKNKDLLKLNIGIKDLLAGKNLQISFKHVLRHRNKIADQLVNENLDNNISGKLM